MNGRNRREILVFYSEADVQYVPRLRQDTISSWKIPEGNNFSVNPENNSVLTKTIIVDKLGYPSMPVHYLKVHCKLLNRAVANSTLCGVEGEDKISLIRFHLRRRTCGQGGILAAAVIGV